MVCRTLDVLDTLLLGMVRVARAARGRALLGLAAGALACAGAASDAPAQETPVAIVNARIITVTGPDIPRGTLVAQGGVIRAVGADVPVPEGATVIDGNGKVIIPGLVDTHSHIGGVAGADRSGTIQPDVRVLDSINPLDAGFRRAVAGGLTTLNIMPGSGHLLSGQTVYVKLRGAPTIEGLFIRPREGTNLPDPMGGLKMANGTNMMGPPPFSATRGKHAALVRERFIKALEYRDAVRRAGGDASKLPARDLGLEAIVEAIEGRRIVHHHTHRADDVMTVLRLQQEFGFRVVLHHVSEAWKLPEELRTAQDEGRVLGLSIISVDSPGGKLEARNLVMSTGAILERAGVRTCLHSDDPITDSRQFLRMGAMAVRHGMSREAALAALTIEGARMMDLADRVGSLEAGKDADFVLLSGEPFSTYTKVERTYVEGELVFDRANAEDAIFATGGFGAGTDQEPYLCCAPVGGFMFGGKAWGN